MKKLFVLILAFLFLGLLIFPAQKTYASGTNTIYTLSADKTSAQANNSDAITITVAAHNYMCAIPWAGGTSPNYACDTADKCPAICQEKTGSSDFIDDSTKFWPSSTMDVRLVSDDSVTIEGSSFQLSNSAPSASKKITSTSVGSKTIQLFISTDSEVYGSIQVNFTEPQAAAKTTKTTATPKTATTPTVDFNLAETKLNSQKIDTTKPLELNGNQKYTLSGKATAKAKVFLVFYSDPITKEVTVDDQGNWQYIIDLSTLNLTSGLHTVKAYAQDSSGNKTTETEIFKFQLTKTATVALTATKIKWPLYLAISLVGIAIIGGAVFLIIRKRKLTKTTIEQN